MKRIICLAFLVFAFSNVLYAKTFVNDGTNLRCMDDNGKYAASAFRWYDDNNDGISELYYFDENGLALKNEEMLLNDYCTDDKGRLYNPELSNKFLQMPNVYVNDTYCTMMTNSQSKEECDAVYKSYYESVEKFINYYVNLKLISIRELGTGEVIETLRNEAEAEIPAYTYGLLPSDIYAFYRNDEVYNKWRAKVDNLRKDALTKIRRA